MEQILKGFREFILRGNVVDLAVAVVTGAAFGAVVTALIRDIITPIIAAFAGEPFFGGLTFTIHKSTFAYGDLINEVITFVTIAAAVYFFVVVPLNAVRARGEQEGDPTTKQCPECRSEIAIDARRCAFCTSPQAA